MSPAHAWYRWAPNPNPGRRTHRRHMINTPGRHTHPPDHEPHALEPRSWPGGGASVTLMPPCEGRCDTCDGVAEHHRGVSDVQQYRAPTAGPGGRLSHLGWPPTIPDPAPARRRPTSRSARSRRHCQDPEGRCWAEWAELWSAAAQWMHVTSARRRTPRCRRRGQPRGAQDVSRRI
ncbi:hypothetical protein LY76DRAFT_594081 [Colletotrichum caudatum]|nr:hypothetical protein LY76DRAFT_594081 [Colletotrichum caudatum]